MFLTPNLHLRALDPETDTPFLLQWRNDATFMNALRQDPAVPCSRPQAQEWIQGLLMKREHGLPIFAVCERYPSSSSNGKEGENAKGEGEGQDRFHTLNDPHEDLFRDGQGRARFPIVGILNVHPGLEWGWANRGCSVAPALWEGVRGRGYGTELMNWACEYIFDTLGLHRIMLRTDGSNAGAIRCYEKVGLIREGVMRKTHWRDGQWSDSVVFAMLEEDWAKIKEARKKG